MIVTIAEDLSGVLAVNDDGSWTRLSGVNPETQVPWVSAANIEAYLSQQIGRPFFWLSADTPIDPPEPVPREISSRQFYQALWEDNERISYEEAEAAINLGTLPAVINAFVLMMEADPATEKEGKRARLALTGAKTFERDHYFVMIFAAMFEMTSEEIDNLWRLAATL